MNIIYIVLAVVVIWSAWSYFSSRVERAQYTVVESKAKYEIRLYPEHIVAQTVVDGTYDEAISKGFRIIAAYIFGSNIKKQSIAMTSPVLEKGESISMTSPVTEGVAYRVPTANKSQSIAMTAPVTATIEGESHIISFGMPKSYTIDTLHIPNDSRVKLVTIPERKMAVMRFTWLRSTARVEKKKTELATAVSADGLQIFGVPEYAGYNAPWTAPWMTRHEVMVEIK